MAKRTNTTTPTKASESVVSRTLAKMLGAPPLEEIEEVCAYYQTQPSAASEEMDAVISKVHGLYAWTTDVAREIMSPTSTPLTEHLMSMPECAFIVKDTARSGADALWLAVADPEPDFMRAIERMSCRGLFHTLPVGQSFSFVVAIQLSSCQL